MARKKAGLYLGVSSVGAALTEGKKLLFLSSEGLSSVEAKDAEISDQSLHWQALVRKSFRQANIDNKKVCLSLVDRDFIIRSLEMPLMKKAEIDSALMYEIEKYIPFKPEELAWDYQYNRLSKERKVRISFVGIRKSSLARTKRFLEGIGLEAKSIEPACLSLVRALKSNKRAKASENFALLDLTAREAYLTFFQEDLPVFNRYLSIEEKEGGLDIDNFAEVVDFSFQYFRREFKETKLDKLFLLTSEESSEKIAVVLRESLSLEVEKLTPYDLTSRQKSSVESLKAFGAAAREDYPYKFKPVLSGVEPKEVEIAQQPLGVSLQVGWRWGWLVLVVGLVAIFYLVASVFFKNMLVRAERDFAKKQSSVALPEELIELGWDNIDRAISQKEGKIQELESFEGRGEKLFSFLEVLSRRDVLLPQIQLEELRVSIRQGRHQAQIRGYIYRGDDFQERQGVNAFVDSLRRQGAVNSLFSRVELSSTSRRRMREFNVTQFTLDLR